MIPDTWTNCYDMNWKNLITPAAFSHPAKFSHGLIKRIYDHALTEGMIQPGGVVLDPFGGVGLGAIYAMQNGLHWVGCELEPRFVELARENIALWNARYAAHFPNWGSAQVLQGDSRNLSEVVSAAGEQRGRGAGEIIVSSPPYAESLRGDNKPDYDRGKIEAAKESGVTAQRSTWGVTNSVGVLTGKGYGSTDGNLGNLPPGTPPQSKIQNPKSKMIVSSPPFAGNSGGRGEASRNGIDPGLFDRHSGGMKKGTGDDPANLDHLPQGTPPMAIVSSPPYVDSMEKSGGIDPAKSNHIGGPHSQMNRSDTRYGESDGQMGAMKAGDISAVIASPPFADSVGSDDPDKRGGLFRDEKRRNDVNLTGTYGETEGQLGAMKAGAHSFTIFFASQENRGIMSLKENELCQDAKIAESKLPGAADGVSPAQENTSANPLKEEKSLKDLGLNSQRQSSMSQCQTIGENSILTGAAAMIDGEDTHGEGSAVQPLNGMDTNAQDADQPSNYKSTTKKAKRKPGESGITNSTTFQPSALPAISSTTGQNGTMQSAQSAENKPEQRPLSSIAPPNAKENPAAEHQKGLIENSTKPINALSAERNLSSKPEDINTAPQSAPVQPGQKSKSNTNEDPDTFWASAKTIVEQCALLLPVGGAAIWVVKGYIKNGQYVDFPGQWQQLCEACGFETVHIHRAMLVKENGEQATMAAGHDTTGTTTNLLGEEVTTAGKALANKKNRTERKSFFRRLHERRRPDLAIDFETVLCTVKSEAA